jgi:hypothetical protein
MTTFSEWFRIGGHAPAPVTPPAGGDGRSIVLTLGHSPKGRAVAATGDILQAETLVEERQTYSNTQ